MSTTATKTKAKPSHGKAITAYPGSISSVDEEIQNVAENIASRLDRGESGWDQLYGDERCLFERRFANRFEADQYFGRVRKAIGLRPRSISDSEIRKKKAELEERRSAGEKDRAEIEKQIAKSNAKLEAIDRPIRDLDRSVSDAEEVRRQLIACAPPWSQEEASRAHRFASKQFAHPANEARNRIAYIDVLADLDPTSDRATELAVIAKNHGDTPKGLIVTQEWKGTNEIRYTVNTAVWSAWMVTLQADRVELKQVDEKNSKAFEDAEFNEKAALEYYADRWGLID